MWRLTASNNHNALIRVQLWIAWWTSWICMEIITMQEWRSMMKKTIMEWNIRNCWRLGGVDWNKITPLRSKWEHSGWLLAQNEAQGTANWCNPSHWTTSLGIACSSFNYVHAMFMLWKTLHWRLHVNWLDFWICRVATCLTLRYSLGNGNHPVPVAGIQLGRSGAESRNKII